MGLFKSTWGGYKWKNIFIAIVLGLVGIFAYTYFTTGAITTKGVNLDVLRTFLLEGTGLLKNLLVAAIIVLPLIIQGKLGIFEKATTTLWALTIGMLLFLSIGGAIPIKGAFYFAWIFNGILLIIASLKKETPLEPSMSWLVFGLTSVAIAPFFSIVSGNPSTLWIILGMIGMGITYRRKGFKLLGNFKFSIFNKTNKDETDELNNEGKDITEDSKNTKTETTCVSDADRIAEGISNVLAAGNTEKLPGFVEHFKRNVSLASNIAPTDVLTHKLFLEIIEKQQEFQARTTHRLLDLLEKEKFGETNIGRAQAYLYELGRKFLAEMTSKTSRWEEFEKMKESGFKEIVAKLKETKNKRLNSYARIIEKHAKRIGIKTFVGMCTRWVKEINKERESLGESVENEFKILEKTGREIRVITEQIDSEFKKINEQKSVLKRYDLQAREYYAEMLRQIDELNRTDIGRDAKIKLIGGMRDKLRWISEYLARKDKILSETRPNLKKIEGLIQNSKAITARNGKTMKKLEEIDEQLGLNVVPVGAA